MEGCKRAEWMLLDYFHFVVHVFNGERREFYALERLWGSAERDPAARRTPAGQGTRLARVGGRALAPVVQPARVVIGALSVLIAPRCLTCRTSLDAPIDGPVCASCWQAVVPFTPPLCGTCGDPLPAWRGRDLSSALCVALPPAACPARPAREPPGPTRALRQILFAIKYQRRRTLAGRLSALMRERGQEVLDGADCRGAGAAALAAAARAGVQPGRRPRTRPGPARRARAAPGPRHGPAVRPERLAAAPQRAGRLRPSTAGSPAPAPARPAPARRVRRARRRRVHDGRHARGVRAVLKAGGAREVRALTAARAAAMPRG